MSNWTTYTASHDGTAYALTSKNPITHVVVPAPGVDHWNGTQCDGTARPLHGRVSRSSAVAASSLYDRDTVVVVECLPQQ